MYSSDIKQLVVSMYSKMKSLRKVNALTNISKSTISRWVNNIYYVKNKKINKLTPVIIDSIKITLKLHLLMKFNLILKIHLISIVLQI